METKEFEKTLLQDNLKQAVRNCKVLKVDHRQLSASFRITSLSFLDFTEDKFKNGIHSYRMDSSIEITSKNSDVIETNCVIRFDASITGTDVQLISDMVIAENFAIPLNLEL